MPRGKYKRKSIEERFFEKVIINKGECWGWKGGLAHFGYGLMKVRGKNDRAHRISWRIHKGEIPKGKLVLHKCDNPICSNPEHLYLGTQSDNVKDIYNRNRRSQRGEKNNQSKLKENQVREIRKKYTGKRGELKSLGEEYRVNYNTIRLIIRNERWKHIE